MSSEVPNEEDEDDYMSDALLQKLEAAAEPKKGTVHKLFQSGAPRPRNRRDDASVVLSEGLARPIPETNVGFKLLSRMGYKKDNDAASRDPIELVVKKSRAGLGAEEPDRKEARRTQEEGTQNLQEGIASRGDFAVVNSYMKQQGDQFETRKLKSQLAKAKQAEMTLREIMSMPLENESHAVSALTDDPAEIDLDGDVVDNKVSIQQHEDEEAPREESLEIKEDNRRVQVIDGDLPDAMPLRVVSVAKSMEGGFEEPEYAIMLQRKVHELRTAPFFYCFYCGHRYENADDLEVNCPGTTEDDHA